MVILIYYSSNIFTSKNKLPAPNELALGAEIMNVLGSFTVLLKQYWRGYVAQARRQKGTICKESTSLVASENHHCPNEFCCYVSHLFVEYWQRNPECTYVFHCCDERPCVNKFLKFLHTVSPSVTPPSVQPTTFPCGNSM